MNDVWIALGLTVFAGMATGIGSAIAFLAKKTDYRFLSIATGFSAGVMLYVSFVEIFVKGTDALVARYGDPLGHWVNAGSFFGGVLLIGLIDNLIPSAENPHEIHAKTELDVLKDTRSLSSAEAGTTASLQSEQTVAAQGVHDHKLHRMGLFTALAIAIHNFPEGLDVEVFSFDMLAEAARRAASAL